MKQSHKTIFLWLVFLLIFVFIWKIMTESGKDSDAIPFNAFQSAVEAGAIAEVEVRTNSLGLRGAELELPKPRDRRRLFFLGDSVVLGWGVGDGVYWVVPFLGPSNGRDFVGFAGNFFLGLGGSFCGSDRCRSRRHTAR